MKCTLLSGVLGYIKVLHIEPYKKYLPASPIYDMKLQIQNTSSVYNRTYYSYDQFILNNWGDRKTRHGISNWDITYKAKLGLNCTEEYSYEIDDYIISINRKNKKVLFYYKPLKTEYCRDIYTVKYQNSNYNELDIDTINHEFVYNDNKIIIEKCDFISIGPRLFYMSSSDFSIYIVKGSKDLDNSFGSIDIYYVKDNNIQKFISDITDINKRRK